MILAYFQSSRGRFEKVLFCVVCHKFQRWSLQKGLFCVACHASADKRSSSHVLNCCSHALVILAYFQSSRGLEVALKSPVLSGAFHKFQSGRFEIEKACSVLRVTHQCIREDSVTF